MEHHILPDVHLGTDRNTVTRPNGMTVWIIPRIFCNTHSKYRSTESQTEIAGRTIKDQQKNVCTDYKTTSIRNSRNKVVHQNTEGILK
jgi:hypothetical protein